MAFKLKQVIEASSLASLINAEFYGADILIDNVASKDQIQKNSISFSQTTEFYENTCLIVPDLPSNHESKNSSFIVTSNPRLGFVEILEYLVKEVGFTHNNFESKIDPTAKIGKNVVIEQGCVIGKNVIIEHNTTIHSGTVIGDNSRIRSNCSVGGEGFGFETLEDGSTIRFVHLGGVKIGNDVEIGALNSIVRGALSDTVIEDFVKTDNLVHIAHNCFIGRGSLLTASAEISGSVEIGKNVWLGPNCSVNNKIKIGDRAFIGLGAVVTKSIPAGEVWVGSPAKFIKKVS